MFWLPPSRAGQRRMRHQSCMENDTTRFSERRKSILLQVKGKTEKNNQSRFDAYNVTLIISKESCLLHSSGSWYYFILMVLLVCGLFQVFLFYNFTSFQIKVHQREKKEAKMWVYQKISTSWHCLSSVFLVNHFYFLYSHKRRNDALILRQSIMKSTNYCNVNKALRVAILEYIPSCIFKKMQCVLMTWHV